MRNRVFAFVVSAQNGTWTPISSLPQARGLSGHVILHPEATEEQEKELRWCVASDSRFTIQRLPELPMWRRDCDDGRLLF